MSETKFTPGPWRIVEEYIFSIGDIISILDTSDNTILNCGVPYEGRTPENKHDMNLIAAAPDMYEALEAAILEYGKPGGPWIDKAKAAIVKARGEQ